MCKIESLILSEGLEAFLFFLGALIVSSPVDAIAGRFGFRFAGVNQQWCRFFEKPDKVLSALNRITFILFHFFYLTKSHECLPNLIPYCIF